MQREAEERLGVLGIEVTAAETVDAAQAEGVVLRVILESGLDFVRNVGAVRSVGAGALSDENRLYASQGITDGVGGEGPEQVRAEHTGPDSLGAELVDHVLCGLSRRVDQENGDLGVLHAIEVDRVVAPTAQGLVFSDNLRDGCHRGVHRPLELVLVVDQIGVVHVRTDRHGMPRIECLHRLGHRAQPVLNRGVLSKGEDSALLVAREETVEGHDRR